MTAFRGVSFSPKRFASLAVPVAVVLAAGAGAISVSAEGGGEAPLLPGVPSSIKTIYVVGFEHMDIGFNAPPEQMRDRCKQHIDDRVSFARTLPDYVWNVEDTWDFENWLDRSTPSQIEEMVGLIHTGRIGLGAGHSSLHGGKAGVEELNRFLYNARRYRERWGFPLETVFHDDVPGVSWAYPQVLARSGVKYLVCGENLGVTGGGFTQPYESYLFYWEGPDGSRVLTWSTQNGYNEGLLKYGIPYGRGYWVTIIDDEELESALKELTTAGYPYDTLMVLHARDARSDEDVTAVPYDAIKNWNANYENPKFILGRPETFFEVMLEKYGDVIPVKSGNWTAPWDTMQMFAPRSEKIVKHSQSQVPSAEKIWAIASLLELGDYPHDEFDNAWDMMLTVDEHNDSGPGWPGNYTQTQLDDENAQLWGYALSAQESTARALTSGREALVAVGAIPDFDSLIVFNPLSWERTDLARIELGTELFGEDFLLQDAVTLDTVPYQKDPATQSVLFVAGDVPPVGFKRFYVLHTPPPPPSTSLTVGGVGDDLVVENDRFRVELNPLGRVTSILDRTASRDIVLSSPTERGHRFNQALHGTNEEFFLNMGDPVPEPLEPTIGVGMSGPVAASLRVESPDHPVAAAEFILYEGLARIDIINTADRDKFTHAPASENSRYYGFTFPFDLTGYTARIETAAGWLDPALDCLEGSFTGSFAVQNGVDISEAGYGISFAAPDVYVHAFGGFQTPFPGYPPSEPTVVSTFVRYADQAELKYGATGVVTVEPGADPQWDLHYSIIPHNRAFDLVLDAKALWEISTPLVGVELPAMAGGSLTESRRSFFSVDVDNVIVTDIKKADFGQGIIVRLQEIGGEAVDAEMSWSGTDVYTVTETSPVEEDIEVLAYSFRDPLSPSVVVGMGSHEILSLRLGFDPPAGNLDSDADGIVNEEDNCAAFANPDQLDTNQDGYGNACDADYDDDGDVDADDLEAFKAAFGRQGDYDPDIDCQGDGRINTVDFVCFKRLEGLPPGPSGLACAGVVPCIADADGDGVRNLDDNCSIFANPDQLDTNQDGYGNACDADYDDDGDVDADDLEAFKAAFGRQGDYDPDIDCQGDGRINAVDFVCFKRLEGLPPGPSGLLCAGTAPCVLSE